MQAPSAPHTRPIDSASSRMVETGLPKGRHRRKSLVWFFMRILIGAAILWAILSRLEPRQVLQSLYGVSWQPLLLAGLIYFLGKVPWTIRWQEILHAVGMERPFGELYVLLLISVFFNNFFPSAVGGDLIRGYYVSRGKENMITGYSAVLVERLLGLITLGLISALAALVALVMHDGHLPRDLLLVVGGIGLAIAVGGTLFFAWIGWHRWFASLSWHGPRVSRIVAGCSEAFEVFHRPNARHGRMIAASFGVQISAALFYLCCARAVGILLPALVFFLVVPVAAVAAMIPVTFNGLGVREGVLAGLMVGAGVPPDLSGAFVLLALVTSTLLALPGGALYPLYAASKKH